MVGVKRFSDPVHGTMEFSELEVAVIQTRVFQRLRRIRQLGFVYYVFPSAGFSRFEHSLGVCHVTGLLLDALRAAGEEITEEEFRLYRLAGLLHDVGHYPFSHAIEEALKDYYQPEELGLSDDEEHPPSYDHEAVGKRILEGDPELSALLDQVDIAAEDIHAIFTREKPPEYANLISSDLDADRVDYLMRTAHATGLPYGNVDLPYLLSHIRVDNQNRLCLREKALRPVDHFLLSRFFQYQQVIFHKAATGFELLLKDIIRPALKHADRECSGAEIVKQIESGKWESFDEAEVNGWFRELATGDDLTAEKARHLLRRRVPRLVYSTERLSRQDDNGFDNHQFRVNRVVDDACGDLGIDPNRTYVWTQAGRSLTKTPAMISISAVGDGEFEEAEYEQTVRILDGESSQSVLDCPNSMMRVLANHKLSTIRVYLVTEDEEVEADLRQKLESELN